MKKKSQISDHKSQYDKNLITNSKSKSKYKNENKSNIRVLRRAQVAQVRASLCASSHRIRDHAHLEIYSNANGHAGKSKTGSTPVLTSHTHSHSRSRGGAFRYAASRTPDSLARSPQPLPAKAPLSSWLSRTLSCCSAARCLSPRALAGAAPESREPRRRPPPRTARSP